MGVGYFQISLKHTMFSKGKKYIQRRSQKQTEDHGSPGPLMVLGLAQVDPRGWATRDI